MPVDIIVLHDPEENEAEPWVVQIGAGEDGNFNSRHPRKTDALDRAHKEARRREARGGEVIVSAQTTKGDTKVMAEYGMGGAEADEDADDEDEDEE